MKRTRSKRVPLTPSVVYALQNKGMSQQEIAKTTGFTKQRVSQVVAEHPDWFPPTPRQIALEQFPFKLRKPYTNTTVANNLRDHGEYWATNGEGMPEYKLKRLRSLYQKLEDTVIEFDPNIPGEPGNVQGGFAFRPRESSDGDLLIRVNEYTTLTDVGRRIWRRLPVEEWPAAP